MSDETKDLASAEAGSAETKSVDPVKSGESTQSESKVDLSAYIPKKDYEELQSKLGEQGQELGEYREFYSKLNPLFDKLSGNDEMIQAIVDGKLDATVVQAVLDGKFKIEDAIIVDEAKKEVQQEMGKKSYENADPEEIEKRILAKIDKTLEEKTKKIESNAEYVRKDYENQRKIEDFISSTPDFTDYVTQIDKWQDEHGIYDLEIAYQAVKGAELIKESKKLQQEKEGEAAKELALNASAGGSESNRSIPRNDLGNIIDLSKGKPSSIF